MEVSIPGGVGFVDAAVFDGFNVGRFANQGGLVQGLTCLASDLQLGVGNFIDAECAARALCHLRW